LNVLGGVVEAADADATAGVTAVARP